MNPHITIRPVSESDAEELVRVTQKSYLINQEYDEDFKKEFLFPDSSYDFFAQEMMEAGECFFVAEISNNIVGFISGIKKEIPYRKSNYIEIESLAVDPHYSRMGIGGLLLNALENKARQLGFNKIYVNTYIKNRIATSFYKKLGFSEIDICLEKQI